MVKKGTEGIFDYRGNPVNGQLSLSAGIRNPDRWLASFVQDQIKKKCTYRYGMQTILIVYLDAFFGTERTVTEIRKTVSIPEKTPFFEIYVYLEMPSTDPFTFFNWHYGGKRPFFRIYPTTDKLYNLDEQELSRQKVLYKSQCEEREKWIKTCLEMSDEDFENLCGSVVLH